MKLCEENIHVDEADIDIDPDAIEKIKKAIDDNDSVLVKKIVGVLTDKFELDDYQVFAVFQAVDKDLTQDKFAELTGEEEGDDEDGDEEERE